MQKEIYMDHYKNLRVLCTQGKSSQDSVYHKYGIEIDLENLLEYLKYLVNLTVANTFTQEKVLEILLKIDCTPATGKYLVIISNNILSDSLHFRTKFLTENLHILNFCIDCVSHDSDENFEWSYYLLSKLHPDGLEELSSIIDPLKFIKVLEFLIIRLEKSWTDQESAIPSILSLSDLSFICRQFTSQETHIIIINFATRELSQISPITDLLLSSNTLSKCYALLKSTSIEGHKPLFLQIIANTISLSTIPLLLQNTSTILQSAELDIKQITTREWVFVIIRNAIPISEEFHESLDKIYKSIQK